MISTTSATGDKFRGHHHWRNRRHRPDREADLKKNIRQTSHKLAHAHRRAVMRIDLSLENINRYLTRRNIGIGPMSPDETTLIMSLKIFINSSLIILIIKCSSEIVASARRGIVFIRVTAAFSRATAYAAAISDISSIYVCAASSPVAPTY